MMERAAKLSAAVLVPIRMAEFILLADVGAVLAIRLHVASVRAAKASGFVLSSSRHSPGPELNLAGNFDDEDSYDINCLIFAEELVDWLDGQQVRLPICPDTRSGQANQDFPGVSMSPCCGR